MDGRRNSAIGSKQIHSRSKSFSFWNCDYSFPMVEIQGRLLSSDGKAIPNFPVYVRRNNFSFGYAYTDDMGIFKGKVPREIVNFNGFFNPFFIGMLLNLILDYAALFI